MIPAIITIVLIVAYVIGIFVIDYKRRHHGKPSIFADTCGCGGHGSRLVRQFRKAHPKKQG